MDDHRTLDEFGNESGNESAERDPEGAETASESAEATPESAETDPKAVEPSPDTTQGEVDSEAETADESEPPATTYRWTPDGAACADCGATVERRWRDGDVFVCADCKEW